ncbi:MAG: hypothetical protein RJQ09_19125 [Cyclobacteriaceae bacterium]
MTKTKITTGLLAISFVTIIVMGFKTTQTDEGYEWHQMTAIESVIPGGIGRSRLIDIDTEGEMEEIKLENFFSLGGINFGNVRNNDEVITQKVATLTKDGWELYNVTSGVYSGTKNGSQGIFITRYLFRRKN